MRLLTPRAFGSMFRSAIPPRLATVIGAIALATTLHGGGVHAQSSSIGLDDPLAPGGVSIGAKVADAEAALMRAGFQRSAECSYVKRVPPAGFMAVTLQASPQCASDASIRWVLYERSNTRIDGSPMELVEQISRKLGKEATCPITTRVVTACNWPAPPGAPLVENVQFTHTIISSKLGTSNLKLELTGASDLKSDQGSSGTSPRAQGKGEAPTPLEAPAGTGGRGGAEARPSSTELDDPLAPGGVTIGAKLADVDRMLTSAGYRKHPLCRYAKSGSTKSINLTLRAGQQCEADAPVSRIAYNESNLRMEAILAEKPADLVQRISRRLGSESTCPVFPSGVSCKWPSPPAAPLVKIVELSYTPQGLFLTLTGVDEHTTGGSPVPTRVPSSSRPPEPIAAGPIASRSGRFELEGVQLGMTPAQVTAALQAKGFVPVDRGKGGGFVKEGAARGKETTRAGVTYLRPTGPYRAEQAEAVSITYPKGKELGVKKHPLFGELTAKYGDPECTSTSSCTWVRRTEGWGETLELQVSFRVNVILKATDIDRAKFSQLAASASVPSSAESQSAPTSATGPSASPASDFDALAPHGVRVGMAYSEVPAALKAAGFKDIGRGCRWNREQGSRKEGISLWLAGQREPRCEGGAPVGMVEYSLADTKGLGAQPESFIASMNKQLGMEAQCKGNHVRKNFECKWESPPNAPYAREISASLSPERIRYQIFPKQDASLRRAPSTADKTEMPSGDQFWWTQELATANAKGLGKEFAQSEQFRQLPADRQAQLNEQSQTVYSYCKSREPFRDLHDCSCVADRFVDARMKAQSELAAPRPPQPTCAPGDKACLQLAASRQQEWEMKEKVRQNRMSDNSQATIIDMADREAHQCPSKAGVANFAHRQCIATYGRRMNQDDLKSFCTCYADTSATNYMKEPVAHYGTLTGAAAGAIQECARQGLPSPLPGKSSGSQKRER
jgi:hypothetical protein